MYYWRQGYWLKLTRWLLLLVVLGQSALLLHDSLHSGGAGDTQCQLCLHAQPQLPAVDVMPNIPVCFAQSSTVALRLTKPVYFSSRYSYFSRGPPRA
ncbi:MAG: hypothetical protein PVG50_01130 [Thiohalophilus sp.]|jgi:hypothetical protein